MQGNLNDLLSRCDTPLSRHQIKEAISCYYAGAYRSAIVATYTAVCYDLIEKLKALALSGDGAAKEATEKFSNIHDSLRNGAPDSQKRMLEFERDLIPIFRDKFGFFGYDQEVEILRVREDRNKCAHPSFYSDGVPYKPNAELARLHIVNAIEIVLSQQPRQGKFATEQFINVISDRYFPEDPEDILARLKSLGLERARESLIISLIDEICFSLAEEKPPLRGSINGFRAVEAIVSIHPDIAAPRLRSNIVKLVNSGDPKAFECSCVLVCRNPDVAETLDDGIRSAIRAWVPKQTTLRGGVLARAVRISWLKEIAIQESEHITREDLKGVAIPLPDEILSAFARRYAQSSNWNEANENYQSFISPYLNRLREKEIRLICNSAITGEGDLLGSHGFKEFIRRLHAESPAPGIEAIIADCGITPDGKIIH